MKKYVVELFVVKGSCSEKSSVFLDVLLWPNGAFEFWPFIVCRGEKRPLTMFNVLEIMDEGEVLEYKVPELLIRALDIIERVFGGELRRIVCPHMEQFYSSLVSKFGYLKANEILKEKGIEKCPVCGHEIGREYRRVQRKWMKNFILLFIKTYGREVYVGRRTSKNARNIYGSNRER